VTETTNVQQAGHRVKRS